jgi:signal transduction histidine kinase/CheY-like chemotaxis protein
MMAGESWSGELEVRRKDGTTFPASLTGIPIFDDDGEAVGLISVSTDLTARKALEERLLRSQRAQGVGRVAGGVAHELNRCLTGIVGHAELIRRELEEEDLLIEDLEEIEASSRTAAALVQQLLSYSRRPVVRPRVVSLNGVVGGMSSVIRAVLGEKIQVSLDPTADPDTVQVDLDQLEQVVTNLVLNAQEAILDTGRVKIRTETIELTNEDADRYSDPVATGRYVSLLVEDDGVGMDAETLKHAFEPFYTAREGGTGAGLGLSTTYGIIKQSGGSVRVDSSPSRGTTVRLVLPVAASEEPGAPVSPATPSPHPGRVVLLVEDDPAVRDLALGTLREDGHEVLEAEDGRAALLLWEQHADRVDLVVTDVMLPRMSGRALVDRLRLFRPELPALFLSGYTSDAAALHGITEGRDPFVGKPFSPEALSGKVLDLLSEVISD